MEIRIIARHCEVPAAIRERTRLRLERLQRFDARLQAADVIFDLEHNVHRVEAKVAVAGGPTLVAEARGDTLASGLEKVFDRIRRQVKRNHDRRLEYHVAAGPGFENAADD